MPIYEYECSQCGGITEAWQKFSDPPLTTCERCQGTLRRLISQSSFHLKGSGWYVTDYKKPGQTSSFSSHKEGGGEKSAGDTVPKKESASESKE
jgi:putative FmdB family regulatory protein